VDILAGLASGFAVAFTPTNLLYCLLGSVVGTAIGVLPGLGPPATIALLLPVTYNIAPTSAVILLAGIFYGAMYGGSTTSILLNIPGEAASVVTCLDGYQMARQGRAGAALALSAFGSFIAGTLSIVGLMVLAPPLAAFALKFGAHENAALLILGLMMAGYLAGASMTKGLVMVALGLLLGTVGLDPIMGSPRFTFGVFKLSEGFEFVLVAMGLFGIGEVLANVEQSTAADVFKTRIRGLLPSREEWRQAAAPIARGSLLGFFIGVLPGGGAIISSFVSYALEKRLSRHPERFGKGAVEGVIAPETASNAKEGGSLLPTLFFGIPGSSGMAILLGAFLILGIQPGPTLITDRLDLVWMLIWALVVGNIMAVSILLVFARWVAVLTFVRGEILIPFILILCVIGSFVNESQWQNLVILVLLSAIGYGLLRAGWPRAPFAIGLVLGGLAEKSLHKALALWGMEFFLRPLSLVLIGLIVLTIAWAVYSGRRRRTEAEVPYAA
jgi:putative tricarboxylic transport membrane protein